MKCSYQTYLPSILSSSTLASTTSGASAADSILKIDGFPGACSKPYSADLNGDQFADLVIGVPGEDLGATSNGGAVNILYGSASGITTSNDQIFAQDNPDVAGAPEAGDSFGAAVAAGDFNGDGFVDIAVGVPGEDLGATANGGAVNILYGSASGITTDGDQIFAEDNPDVAGAPEAGDEFGSAVVAGFFNGDRYMDLAVGVPSEDLGGTADGGAVNILYGSATGITTDGDQIFAQDNPDVAGAPEAGDRFGSDLAAGDFNGDGLTDLAIGVPGEDLGATSNGGAVNILYGSGSGITTAGNQILAQDNPDIAGAPEEGDFFGRSVTAGDFNNDGFADLAVGVPGEDLGATSNGGAVNILYGSPSGITTDGDQIFAQDNPDVAGAPEAGDIFGSSVTAGDFNNDGFADLAVGVPGEDLGATSNGGAVNILYGSSTGITTDGNQIFAQDNPDVAGAPEAGDLFGSEFDHR